ncbi:MAG: histidine kinase [Bacteroidota bacterium]
MIAFLQKRWVYHSLIWFLLTLFLGFLIWKSGDFETTGRFVSVLVTIILSLSVSVYLAFYFKRRFFDRRQYGRFVLGLLLTIGIGVGVIEGLFFLLGNPSALTQNIQNVAFIVLIAIGLQYFKRGIINQYQIQELRAKNAETELHTLKTQLNPHFLFNTLNNIYAINQMNAEQGSEMILELSEVMRHHLHFSQRQTVPLSDTIQFIQSYIELEKLRLNENCDLKVNIETGKSSICIAPLLLLPFIENAFKYGTHPLQPCFIHISLQVQERQLFFEVKNSIIANKKTIQTGIGLENTKRRLALIYPNRHELNIESTDKVYTVELKIDL